MFRRRVIAVSLAASIAALAVPAAASAARPNVLVVMADDMSYDNLKFMPKTTAFFKSQGTSFTKNYITYPLCCPARTTFLTGQLAHNHGVSSVFSPDNFIGWKTKDNNMAAWLQKDGYNTGLSGKYLNGYGELKPKEVPKGWSDWRGSVDDTTIDAFNVRYNLNGKIVNHGDPDWIERTALFSNVAGRGDIILDYPGLVAQIGKFFMSRPQPWSFGTTEAKNYTTAVEGAAARDTIAKFSKANKPWFEYYTPPSQHREDIAEQANAGRDIGGPNPRLPEPYASRVKDLVLPRGPSFAEQDVSDLRAALRPPLMKNTLAEDCVQCLLKLTHYYQGRAGASMALDDQFGMMVDQLKKSGKLKNTLIILTADNGWLMGQHNINGNKYLPYEESTHVPLLVAGPGVPKGKTNDALVANVDLTPTIVAATGTKAQRVSDGMSLFTVMKNPAKGRSAIPLEATRKLFVKPGNFPNPEDIPYYGVRTKDFMYARYVDDAGNFSADSAEEMYNMVADPFQMTNLVARPTDSSSAKLAELRKLALELKSCQGKACVR